MGAAACVILQVNKVGPGNAGFVGGSALNTAYAAHSTIAGGFDNLVGKACGVVATKRDLTQAFPLYQLRAVEWRTAGFCDALACGHGLRMHP